jgi:hypothetical protein
MTTNTATTAIINDFVGKLSSAIETDVRARLTAAVAQIGGNGNAAGRLRANPLAHTPRLVASTPALTRARALQGKYLGALRTAKGNRRARAKALAKKEGVAAALKFLAK